MKYLILLPLAILYVWWSVHSIKRFYKGDYFEYPDTAAWLAITFMGYIVTLAVVFN